MKKIMSLMLGLALVLGTSAAFAQEKPATDKKESKKKGGKKKAEGTATDSSAAKK